MNADERKYINGLVQTVVGAAYDVSNAPGCGFLEKVYERALLRELALRGIRAQSQVSFSLAYKGQSVGDYCADLLVENKLLVELKCVECFSSEHTARVVLDF